MDVNEIQGEIDALKILLSQTDYVALKVAEAEMYSDSTEEFESVINKRGEWRKRINELEAELNDAAENTTNENT